MKKHSLLAVVVAALLACMQGCPDGADDDDEVAGDDDDDIQDDDAVGDDDTTDNLPPCDDPLDDVEVKHAEAEEGEGTPDDCDELNVELYDTQEDFEARFESLFPHTAANYGVPTGIDFNANMLILSHITYCPAGGYELVVDWVCLDGGVLDVYETLWHPEGYLGVTGKPYNLTTVPAGDYTAVVGHLSEAYMEKGR